MQSSSTLAIMVAGGVLIYALSKKSKDHPPPNVTPPPPPTLTVLPGPVGVDPTIKGFRSDYPATWPAGAFCAMNDAYKTPRFVMNPGFEYEKYGCDPTNQGACSPILNFQPAFAGLTQEQCMNFRPGTEDQPPNPTALYQQTSALIGTQTPQNPTPPGWMDWMTLSTQSDGWWSPGGPQLIWFDPLRQTATYHSVLTNLPAVVDASEFSYSL